MNAWSLSIFPMNILSSVSWMGAEFLYRWCGTHAWQEQLLRISQIGRFVEVVTDYIGLSLMKT